MSSHNLGEIEEIVDLVDLLGVRFFQFIIVNHLGRAARRDMFAQGHSRLYEILLDLAHRRPSFRDALRDSTLGNLIACSVAGLYFHHCGLGFQKNYYVQADGDVFPCRATIRPEFKIGNVRDPSFESFDQFQHQLLQSFRAAGVDDLNQTCATCEHRYSCAGDCRGETYQTTGSFSVPHPSCADLRASFYTVLWAAIDDPNLYFDKTEAFYRRTGIRDAISQVLSTPT
ncbi:MAG: SPASM domain-containing protein [Magnetospirillum sp. WYHS-4]